MSFTRAAAEVQKYYEQTMGDELGLVFYRLWNETAWLHAKWDAYVALFGTSPERIALLNQAAPMSAKLIQDSLWDDVLLHICSLTDPPGTSARENLTIEKFPALVQDTPIANKVEALLEDVRTRTKPLRVLRNKRISHRDLLIATGGADPLPEPSRDAVREALAALVSVLHVVESHFCQAETMYDAGAGFDATGLLYVLRDGLHFRAQRDERVRQGKATPEDYQFRPI